MKTAFLICALALPPAKMQAYRLLADLAKHYGTEKIILRGNRIHAVPDGYEKMPFKWRGFTVYFKKSA